MKSGGAGQLLRFPPGVDQIEMQTPGTNYFQLQFGWVLLPVNVSCC